MQKSCIIVFSYWLFKAYFTSRRDDWQTVIHMVFDKVANIVKHMVLGPHLEKEAKIDLGWILAVLLKDVNNWASLVVVGCIPRVAILHSKERMFFNSILIHKQVYYSPISLLQ